MKRETKRWIKVATPALLTALFIALTWTLALRTGSAYGDWMVNRSGVQERLYEAVRMFFAYAQLLILSASLLALSARWLVCAVRAPRAPGGLARLMGRRGHCLALGFALLFALLLLLDRAALGRIANVVETSEAPAALRDHVRSGWLEIGAELAAEGAVFSLVSWARNRKSGRRG